MALFRKFFHRELPEGLLEISERVFVFSCCLTTNHLEGTEYQAYIGRIVDQLREHYPDASFTVHNFGDEHNQTQITNLLSENGITVINYPCQYENCPLLPVETISHFLSSCDDWLYIGQSNVLLMHCQNGAFPILAFMLAALLIYKNRDDGELKSFEMVYKKTPNELLLPLSSVNLLPSQLRYLEYVSKMNVDFRSGPTDSELTLDCVILSGVSDMGCPIFRVYGSEPSTTADQTSKMLFSTPKESKAVRYFKQSDSKLIKIDIKYHVHGDVVLECITLHDDDNLEHEELMFRVMFNTAFIRSNMLMLNIEEIDMLCNVTDKFSKDFRAEVLFSEMDPSSALLGIDSPRTNNEGIPTEASDDKSQDKLRDLESEASVTDNAPNTIQQMNIDSDCTTKKIVSSELQVSVQRPAQSKIISPRISQSSSNSNPSQNVSVPLSRYRAASSALGITALLHDHAEISNGYQHYINSKPPPPRPPPPPPPPHLQSNRSFAGTLLPPPSLSLLSPLTLSPTPPPPPPSPSPSLQSDSHSSASILPKTTSAKFPSPVTSFKNQSSVPSPPTLPPPPFRDPPLASPAPPPPPPPFSNVPIVQNQSATTPPPPPPLPAPSSSTACQDSPFIPAKKSTLPGAPCPPPPPQRGCSATISTTICSVTPPKCAGLSKAPPPPAPLSNGISKSGSGAALKGKLQFRTGTRTQPQPKKTPLRPYHWLKLSRAMQGSLWAEAQKPEEVSKVLELDMSELESLFSTTIPNSDHGGKTNRRGSSLKPDKVHLIELRRAYNCEIMLTKVKVPLSDLMTSVLALDDSSLDIDQVDNLIKFCPTKEEIELLKNYNGDKENLGKCEQFFLELMKVPRVESKLRVFSFKIQFCSQVSDLKNSLNIVSSASQEVRGSAKLKRIMQTILSLGNALNHGTARGSAVGFRLDSLLKLSETRSRNNKLTLIHYLCKVLAEKLPEVMDFHKDLVSLEAATKIQLKYLAEEMQAISKGLEKAVQELTASQNDGTVSEYFCKTLKEFYGSAEAEVHSLASIYSVVGKNADALAFYFGEDPSRCPFEQVVSTLVNFVKMFQRAHEENCKQLEFEKKKALKEAENGKRERVGKESMIVT